MIQLLSALHLMVAALLGGLPAAPQATPVASPIGRGPGFELPTGTRADRARPIGALRCTRPAGRWAEAHVEVFARGRVVILPPGIGIARPRRQVGATVVRGRCSYPLHTADPTGVVGFRPGRRLTLGDLFAVW